MNHKTRIVFLVLAALALVISFFGAADGAKPTVASSGSVFTVYPTGVDDTQNIRQAFELAKAAGPGSTVLLAPGNFKTRMIEIRDYDGNFKGSGQNVTFVDTFENQECQAWWEAGNDISLFSFKRGYGRVSDMTIHITPASPCQPSDETTIRALTFIPTRFNPATDCESQQIGQVSGSVERVTIQGEGNVEYGIAFWGGADWSIPDCQYNYKYAQGEFRVSKTIIRNVGTAAISPWATIDSRITIGGSEEDANTLDGAYFGIWANDHSGSTLDISHNRIDHVVIGFQTLQDGDWWHPHLVSPATYNIHHNDISVYENGNAIELLDFDNFDGPWYPRIGPMIIANVHHNHFTLNLDYSWAVWGEWLDGAVIHQNTVDGNSNYAMGFGFWGPTLGLKIMNNDLHAFVSTSEPYKIILGPGTENYKVRVDEEDSVLDLGTNNTVNEKIKRGQFGFDAAFVEMMNQKMMMGNQYMPLDRRYQALPLLAPVNYLYLPVVQAK